MNYTKGEWILKTANTNFIHIGTDEQGALATVWRINVPIMNANAHLIATAPDMYEKLTKIHEWLIKQAKRDEDSAINCRFETLKKAYLHDANNYKAMAKDIEEALAKAEGKED